MARKFKENKYITTTILFLLLRSNSFGCNSLLSLHRNFRNELKNQAGIRSCLTLQLFILMNFRNNLFLKGKNR